METFAWSGLTALMLMVAGPALAGDGRTYWECTKFGCVQIAAPTTESVRALPAKTVDAVQPAAAHKPAAANKKSIPVDTLIDLSLVTGVFQ